MLWRVRTTLPDRPGALALLAARCGEAGVNILGLQVFPGVGEVTDELVLGTPEDWNVSEIHALIGSADGAAVVALPCTEAALTDQPSRYVRAARALLERPTSFPEVVAELFDAETEPVPGTAHDTLEMNLEMSIGDVTMQVHRAVPFTATEHARGSALAGLVSDVLSRSRSEVTEHRGGPVESTGEALDVDHLIGEDTVQAIVGGVVVGTALLSDVTGRDDDGGAVRRLSVDVDVGWRRRGVGSRLLHNAARLARSRETAELQLITAAGNPAVLPMALGAGLRARIRMSGTQLIVRLPLADLRPLG